MRQAKYDPWYKAFWHSRQWVIGTVFASALCAMRWFDKVDNVTFAAMFSLMMGYTYVGSAYSKRYAPVKE